MLHIEPDNDDEKTPKVPDGVLRAALLRRATEDIHRIIQIRSAKQACSSLLQRGSVGDELWQRFSRAEKEMEEELRDVVMEVRPLFYTIPPTGLNHLARLTWTSIGKRSRTRLGKLYFPIRQRGCRQHGAA